MPTLRSSGLSLCWLSLIASVAYADGERQPITREDLIDVLKAAHADLRDVEFIYEGGIWSHQNPDWHRVPPQLRRSSTPPEPGLRQSFQARFAYRSDGVAHLDLYTWGEPEDSSREVSLLLGDGILHRQAFYPGGGPAGVSSSEPGWIGGLFGSYLPLNLHLHLRLVGLLQQPWWEYEFGGWEEVDGRDCLVVKLHRGPNHSATDTFWIDLERQGHPLRYEDTVGSKLIHRITDVVLRQTRTRDSKTVWFPVKCRHLRYEDLFTVVKTPVSETDYGVVRETLLINQGLGDERFSLDYQPASPGQPAPWREAVAEARRVASAEESRTADERLDAMLVEADRQEAQLEASAPSRRSWISRNVVQIGMFAVGAVLIAIATTMRWRAS